MDTKTPSGEGGARIFARLLSLDLSCPGCGHVHRLGQGRDSGSAWDKRTQRFHCKCGVRLALGVIAYSPPAGRATPAWDQIPDARERQELRNQVDSVWVGNPRGERANRLIGVRDPMAPEY